MFCVLNDQYTQYGSGVLCVEPLCVCGCVWCCEQHSILSHGFPKESIISIPHWRVTVGLLVRVSN